MAKLMNDCGGLKPITISREEYERERAKGQKQKQAKPAKPKKK